jgi:uncharacterized membrane protein (UPF0127 family)
MQKNERILVTPIAVDPVTAKDPGNVTSACGQELSMSPDVATEEHRSDGTLRDSGSVALTPAVGSHSVVVRVEIARTHEEQERGLAGRMALAEDAGMLFLFDQPDLYSFWMKDTLIPLDLLFADAGGTIVTVCRDLRPGSEKIYYPSMPSGLVLEVCGGFLERYGIVEGDRISWTSDT